MTRDVVVDGRAAKLVVEGGRLRYTREDGEVFESGFSVAAGSAGVSVVLEGRGFRVMPGREGEILVAGRSVHVETFDPRDHRSRQSGGGAHGSQEIRAPMPGKVIRVLAAAGDAVDEGQDLVVVEAMKMQNTMKSPKAGHVAEVRAREGATVAAGEVLVVVE
jgi:biotin carboxyl carrier protein